MFTILAVHAVSNFFRHEGSGTIEFESLDREARKVIAKRVAQIEVARRFWACPFQAI